MTDSAKGCGKQGQGQLTVPRARLDQKTIVLAVTL